MKTKVPYGMKDYTIHGTELEPFHIYHQIYEHGGLQVPFSLAQRDGMDMGRKRFS
ncbi:MAG: hypothetical protein ACLVAT_03225 [Lachnospiraceae bacterium]